MTAGGCWSLAVTAGIFAVAIPVRFHWDWLLPRLFPPPENKFTFTEWILEHAWRSNPLAWLPFTPLLTCEPYAPTLMQRFDWTIVTASAWNDIYDESFNHTGRTFECCGPVDQLSFQENTKVNNPKTVWAVPHAVERLLELAAEKRLDDKRPSAVVVFSGTELPLSRAFGRNASERQETVRRLKKYFKRIVYQTKDIMLDGVHLAPMGLCWGYTIAMLYEWAQEMDRVPLGQQFTDLARLLRGDLSAKTKDVLATRGAVGGWLENETTIEYIKLLAHLQLLFPPSNSSLRAVVTAFGARKRLKGWLGVEENGTEVRNPVALAAGVDFASVSMKSWWWELAKYKFLLSPTGSGIQVAKNIEALLVLTVPVVMRMGWDSLDELVSLGFPLVLVRGWVEVTPENTSRWWKRLAPRLESFRANCLTTEGYWRLYTGQVTMCV